MTFICVQVLFLARQEELACTAAKPTLPPRPHQKWMRAEDAILRSLGRTLVNSDVRSLWTEIESAIDGRSRLAVRNRWVNSINPNIKRGPWTKEEDKLIAKLEQEATFANKRPSWVEISSVMDGRTANPENKRSPTHALTLVKSPH